MARACQEGRAWSRLPTAWPPRTSPSPRRSGGNSWPCGGPNWAARGSPPLFAEFTAPEERSLATWAALFLAESIYRQRGLSTLAEMAHALATYSSWDRLFDAFLGRTTGAVEHQAAALALGGEEAVPTAETASFALAPTTPLSVTLLAVPDEGRLLVQHPEWPRPVLVEVEGMPVHAATNAPIAPECLGAGSRLTLQAKWKERGYRLRSQQVTVDRLVPPGPDSREAESEDPFDALRAPVAQEAVAFVATLDPRYGHAVAALSGQGALQMLAHATADGGFWMSPLVGEEELRFMVAFSSPSCSWQWYAVYEPFAGRLGPWQEVPPNATSVLWRPEAERLLPVLLPEEVASPQVAVMFSPR
ncbi:MAG: hypothetical protein Q9O62_05830 [Ardenticatenia bacterium]|nr:hypothetical protein [Ardenticatenia bacterium]